MELWTTVLLPISKNVICSKDTELNLALSLLKLLIIVVLGFHYCILARHFCIYKSTFSITI